MKYLLIVFFIVCSMIGEFVPRYEADMQCWKYLYTTICLTWLTAQHVGKTKKIIDRLKTDYTCCSRVNNYNIFLQKK